jgi:hypothetical protein
MGVEYDHSQNIHTVDGPRTAVPLIFAEAKPRSLLDVGCGLGHWLKAGLEFGIQDVFGVDGVPIPKDKLLIPEGLFRQQDLTKSWNLGRRFDAVLCLEVGEHLAPPFAGTLVDALVAHSDLVYFSAACPGQPGQCHVNCQWPSYWQTVFNERGFVCSDAIRWKIWENKGIECWYRQNLFSARKNPPQAGKEARLLAVVHPEVNEYIIRRAAEQRVEDGHMSMAWYAGIPFLALKKKLMRRLS